MAADNLYDRFVLIRLLDIRSIRSKELNCSLIVL